MSTSLDVGRKDDLGKLRFDLVPAEAFEDIVRIYTYGSQKYDDRNWEKGIEWGRVFGAMMRHLWAFWRGETDDPESGMPHMAHAAWGCLTLLEYAHTHRELDDRPATRIRLTAMPSMDVRVENDLGGAQLQQARGKERFCPQCGESEQGLYFLTGCNSCGYPREWKNG